MKEELPKLFARVVNMSSKKRKEFVDSSHRLIRRIRTASAATLRNIERVSRFNIAQRLNNLVIENTCLILQANLREQEASLAIIEHNALLPPQTAAALRGCVAAALRTVETALDRLGALEKLSARLLLRDKKIQLMKSREVKDLARLLRLTERCTGDARESIRGSADNLRRSLSLVARLRGTRSAMASPKRADRELRALIDEAREGRKTSQRVLKKSESQMAYDSQVSAFTARSLHYSRIIKNFIEEKHGLIGEAHGLTGELTALLGGGLKDYIAGVRAVRERAATTSPIINDLLDNIEIAVNDIDEIAEQTRTMVDISSLNASMEKEVLQSTGDEVRMLDELKRLTVLMTEASRIPIEGAAKNIDNGKFLEQLLRRLLKSVA